MPGTTCEGDDNDENDFIAMFSDKKLENLIYLDLSNCPLINGDALKSIAKRCPKLETLNISGCKNVNTKSLKRFKNLKKFVMPL